MAIPTIHGHCDARFRAVRDAFAANFADHDELGASVAISVDDTVVVDLWAGLADREGRPWERDTLVDVFSVGKGMVATSLLILVERGLLNPELAVAHYWPQFAAAGKDQVTVAQLLSHQAGLPGITEILDAETLYDWDAMTAALARQKPWWAPGTASGYHVNTLGFLGGELVRRIDGRGFGDFFRDEVANRLGADFTFGLAGSTDRVATFYFTDGAAENMATANLDNSYSLIYNNPPGASGLGTVNTDRWRRAVHPSTNGHANARAIASIYAALANGGTSGGVRLMSSDTVAIGTTEQVRGHDLILDRPARFGLGFQLTQPERAMGPGAHSFGHYGAGGSLGMADPDAHVAFGYAMNRFGLRWQDPRNRALLTATYESL